MVRCALLDVPCQIGAFLAPVWFWIQFGFWVVVAFLALGALYKINSIFGWRGVVAAISAGAAAFLYKAGFDRGRGGKKLNPIDSEPDPDFTPPLGRKKPHVPTQPKGVKPRSEWTAEEKVRGYPDP